MLLGRMRSTKVILINYEMFVALTDFQIVFLTACFIHEGIPNNWLHHNNQ